jgi:hypothetical protein
LPGKRQRGFDDVKDDTPYAIVFAALAAFRVDLVQRFQPGVQRVQPALKALHDNDGGHKVRCVIAKL